MATLKEKAVYGVKWIGTSSLIVTALKYVKLIVLARLLVPDDFGLMAMLLVIIGLGQAFSDMGISYAIIWKQDANRDQLSSVYWFNIFTGVVVSCIVLAAAPLIAYFFNEPRLNNLILWISPVFLITSIGIPFQMILQKDLLFSRIAKIEIIAASVGTIVAVVTAFLKAGVYALIWGQIAETIIFAILFLVIGSHNWHPHLHFRVKDLKGFLRFGLFQMGERLLNFYYTNVDYIIIGKFLGGDILGIYMLAYQLVIEPFARINPILTRVAFPVFAKRQKDNDALRRGYYELSRMIVFLTFPILALLAVTAPLFIPAILGPKWGPAILLTQILVILGALRALINPLGSILYAKGRTDLGFYWNLITATLNTLIFWILVRFGVYAIAWAENSLTFLYLFIALFILHQIISLRYREYLQALIRPFLANIVIGGIVYVVYILTRGAVGSSIALFVILLILGISLYGSYIVLFERKLFKEYWDMLLMRNAELA